MKLKTGTIDFREGLRSVMGVCGGGSRLEIRATDDGRLLVTASNLGDLTATATVDAAVDASGTLMLDAKVLQNYVSAYTKETIAIETRETHVQVGTIKMPLDDPYEIAPVELADGEGGKSVVGVGAVLYAAADEDARYVFNGVCLSKGRVIATDGRRLSVYSTPGTTFEDLILPTRAARYVAKEHDALVSHDGENFIILNGNVAIRAKQISGTFPDVDQVIPKDAPQCRASFDRDLLLSALSRAKSIDATGIDLYIEGGAARLAAKSASGEFEEILEEAEVSGDDSNSRFNAKYLDDAIRACEGERIIIGMRGEHSPAEISAGDEKHQNILMPMKR